MSSNRLASYILLFVLAIGVNLLGETGAAAAGESEVKSFKDVPAKHWAYVSVQKMIDKGIISGYSDGTFHPTEQLTRAQFAKILTLTLDLDLVSVSEPTFSDVKINSWALPYIETVKAYLEGYSFLLGKSFFDPDAIVTREDVAVALVKGMKLPTDVTNAEQIIRKQVSDYKAITPELAVYVAVAMQNNLIGGFADGTFKPKQGLDRASAVALMSRVINSPKLQPLKEIELEVVLPDIAEKSKVRLQGTVGADNKLFINGKALSHANGTINHELSLDRGEGKYELEIKAVQPNGRYKAIVKQLTYRIPAPVLTIDLPTNSDKQTVTVAGTVMDANDEKPTITVNEVKVSVSSSGNWSRDIRLQEGTNTVRVVATNKLKKSTSVEKKVKFTVKPPELSIDQLPAIVNSKVLTIKGQVVDNNDAYPQVKLNGEVINQKGTILKSYTLVEGDNQLTFEATNSWGKKTTVTKKVKYVILPPDITFDNFPETSVLSEMPIRISAADNDDPNPGIYINDRYLGAKSVNSTLSLREGENTFTIKAKNNLGKQTVIVKKVIYTILPPTLLVDPIPDTTNVKTITIKASATDVADRSPTLYLNGIITGTSSFTRTVTLVEGNNTVTIKATNRQGKSTTVEKKIRYIISPPVVTVDSLPETTEVKTITISASATDAEDRYPRLYMNGTNMGSNSFSKVVTLTEGVNTFEIKATNSAGKTSDTVVKKITYNVPPPTLTIENIPDTTTSANLTLKASASDVNDSSPTLFLDGTNMGTRSFTKTVALVDGENVFTFKAVNQAGKATEVVKKIVYNVPAPTLSIGPLPEVVSTAGITLSATAADPNDMKPQLYLNGQLLGESSFSMFVTLNEGENVFTFKSVNHYGKESVIVKRVVYQPVSQPQGAQESQGSQGSQGSEP